MDMRMRRGRKEGRKEIESNTIWILPKHTWYVEIRESGGEREGNDHFMSV